MCDSEKCRLHFLIPKISRKSLKKEKEKEINNPFFDFSIGSSKNSIFFNNFLSLTLLLQTLSDPSLIQWLFDRCKVLQVNPLSYGLKEKLVHFNLMFKYLYPCTCICLYFICVCESFVNVCAYLCLMSGECTSCPSDIESEYVKIGSFFFLVGLGLKI